jgi:uncharacterized protein YigA (DUF484 family)
MRSTDSEYSPAQLERLENKVDKLTDAVTQLVRVEERQINHGVRIGEVEHKLALTHNNVVMVEKKVDQWINRGIGLWSVAIVLWTLYLGMGKYLG